MNKGLKVACILAVCALAGFGIGTLIGKSMKDSNNSKHYIPQPEISISDGVMTPEALLAFGRVGDPQLSPDGKTILYGVSYNSIADNASCRNLYVCNVDGSGRRQISRFAQSVSNARWSADGSEIFFLQGGQLWKAPYKAGKLGRKVCLSDVPAGISEFKISPDFSKILYLSTIKNTALVQPVDTDPALDKAQAFATEDLMYRHWDHWVTEVPRSYVAPLGEKITPENSVDILGDEPFELPAEPFGGAEQLDWSPDGRYVAYSCRKLTGKQYAFSTNTDIFIYDTKTGETVPVTCGGGYDTDPVWSPDGSRLAWISMPRDGYEADQQRLLVAEISLGEGVPAAGEIKWLSAALDRDAAGIFWTPDSKAVIYNVMTDGKQALYCSSADGSAEPVRLTSADWNYDFFSPFGCSEDASVLYASYYCINFPVELVSIDLAAGTFAQISNENGHILAQLDEIGQEEVWIKTVDGKDMHCWLLYPPHFDESKVYPGIEIVLGGPQGTNSQDWSYRWCYRLMAQQGYVVILPNRRGTTAFGQEWKEEISGDYPGLNMQDYLSAGKWLKAKPFIGKLGCVGASYGGYSAYMLEGLHGDLYDCFIAHAGIFDEKQLWYTTEEMWFANWDNGGLTEYAYTPGEVGPRGDGVTFGGMQQAGAPYASTPKARRHYSSSPASMVTNWHTPILCIHGMMDFRIPYEQGMAAFNAAQMMGVPSKLLIFPEETHWVLQPQNSLYWHREFYAWLDKWLKDNE